MRWNRILEPLLLLVLWSLLSGCAILRPGETEPGRTWRTPGDSSEAVWGRADRFFRDERGPYVGTDTTMEAYGGACDLAFSRRFLPSDSVEFTLDTAACRTWYRGQDIRSLFLTRVRDARSHPWAGPRGSFGITLNPGYIGPPALSIDLRFGVVGASFGITSSDEEIPDYSRDPPSGTIIDTLVYDEGYIGGDLHGYVDILERRGSLFASIGYYHQITAALARNQSQLLYYVGESPTSEPRIGYGIGGTYDFINANLYGIGVYLAGEIHSIRGVSVGGGFLWVM